MDIIIAPNECKKLLQIKYPCPKDGQPQVFLYDEENLNLYETLKYSDEFRSWFIENSFCREGHFNLLTKVDPLFIFLPQLIKYADQNYRLLNDICHEYYSQQESSGLSRLEYALKPDINWENLCDKKQIDDDTFIKYNEAKTIIWLKKKHDQLMMALKDELPKDASKATVISYALDLLDNYVPQSLSNKFKEAVRSQHIVGSSSEKISDSNKAKSSLLEQQSVGRANGQRSNSSKRLCTSETINGTSKELPKNSIANFFKKRK